MQRFLMCPCKDCRPKTETLRQAIKRINRSAELERYGVEGVRRRDEEKRQRLDELRRRRQLQR